MSYEFADRLIAMRRSRGMSQEELARQLGLSRQAISKWERAESAPDVGNLVALADVYGVTLDEVVRGAEPECMAAKSVDDVEAVAEVVAEKPSEKAEAMPVASTADAVADAAPPPPTTSPTIPAAATAATSGADGAAAVPPPPPAAPAAGDAAGRTKVKNPMMSFPYPVLVALIYLVMGMFFDLWHPGWIIFFTIPFYYWIASVVSHDPEFIAHHAGPKG